MGSLQDSNKTTANDEAIIVIADGQTGSAVQAGVTSDYRLKVEDRTYINSTDVNTTATASGTSSSVETYGVGKICFIVNVTAASGTAPTLDVNLQQSNDGTNWVQVSSVPRFTATGTHTSFDFFVAARYYRYSYTIGGTNPSFTFSIMTTLKRGEGQIHYTQFRYGGITTTATGNVSETFRAGPCRVLQVMFHRGSDAGGSLQVRIDGSNDNFYWEELTGDISVASGSALLGNNIVGQAIVTTGYLFYRARVTDNTSVAATVDIFWHSVGG